MNVTDIIHSVLAQHKTRFAFELLPPLKGDGMGGTFAAIDPLVEFDPAYINVTFHREGLKQTLLPDGRTERHVVRRRRRTMSAVQDPASPPSHAGSCIRKGARREK